MPMETGRKILFPYEAIDSLEKLNSKEIPPYSAFYSSLTNSNISVEDYQLVVKTWKNKNNWQSVRDLLVYYNKIDVQPFVGAVVNLLQHYREQNIDLFKESFSVSGAAKLILFKRVERETFFGLIPERDRDLHRLFREKLQGGLCQVFNRLAIAGETQIRPHELDEPLTCAKVVGYDANSCIYTQ